LDLARLVGAEHQGSVGWVQIETHDVTTLLHQLRGSRNAAIYQWFTALAAQGNWPARRPSQATVARGNEGGGRYP
jgi:hypothetical protein